MKSDLKCLKPWIRNELLRWIVRATWPGVLGGHRKIGELGWSSSYTKKETGVNAQTTGAFLSYPPRKSIYQVPWKKMARNKSTKVGIRPGRRTTDQIFTLRQILGKSWEYAKNVFTCFVDLEKARDQVPCDKFWGVLREYGVDDRLLLAAMSLYSYSDICVRVGGVKSQRFTVGDGLQQRCAVTTLHSLYELNRQ